MIVIKKPIVFWNLTGNRKEIDVYNYYFTAFVSRNGEGNQSNDLDLSHGQPLPSLRQLWQSDLQLLWEV